MARPFSRLGAVRPGLILGQATPALGRIIGAGAITNNLAALPRYALGLARGLDGERWYLSNSAPKSVVRITPSGAVTAFWRGLQSNNSGLIDLAAGPGGMWFVHNGRTLAVGRVRTVSARSVCIVPKLIEVTLPHAKAMLKHAGCGLGRVRRRGAANPPQRDGVIAQSVAPGRTVRRGIKVTVTSQASSQRIHHCRHLAPADQPPSAKRQFMRLPLA